MSNDHQAVPPCCCCALLRYLGSLHLLCLFSLGFFLPLFFVLIFAHLSCLFVVPKHLMPLFLAYQRGCVDCAAWGQRVEGLSFVLVLSGIKVPLMRAVRRWCTGCGCCHIEADTGWCQTEERAWGDGDALVRMVMGGSPCSECSWMCCVPGDGLPVSCAVR